MVVAGGKVHFSSDNLVGNLLITASAMLWASGTVISGPLLKQISPLRLAFFSSLLTTPIHLLIVSRDLSAAWPKFAEPNVMWALIYSGIFFHRHRLCNLACGREATGRLARIDLSECCHLSGCPGRLARLERTATAEPNTGWCAHDLWIAADARAAISW